MSFNNSFDEDDLKSRLANYGIICPITNTTRQVLLKKLYKLETNSPNNRTSLSIGYESNDNHSMAS